MIYLIAALLTVIAILEASRLYLSHRKTGKKSHFKQKLEGVEKMVWDLEFKAFKTREIREGVRQEYDLMNQRIDSIKKQIENWPKDSDEGEKKRTEDKLVICQRDADRLKGQLKALDEEVDGAKPSAENPNGAIGINHNIDSLAELSGMLKSWIKSL